MYFHKLKAAIENRPDQTPKSPENRENLDFQQILNPNKIPGKLKYTLLPKSLVILD
jgi:hypothetical protein